MGHITSKNYHDLQKRLDRSVQGAPESEALFKILKILFTEEEAELTSKLPLKIFTPKAAAKRWNKDLDETKKILKKLADKGLLLDFKYKNGMIYVLAPTMAGFFEFSLMRTDGKFDTKVLSELFYQYINVENKFAKKVLFAHPSIARTFIQEDRIQEKDEKIILDYERASKVIEDADFITIGRCYCRHKMEHKGKACNQPQMVCMTFNKPAKSLARHGIAKRVSKKKAKEILNDCISRGLVQIGDNVQDSVSWICNCCGCCCEALLAYKKLGHNPKINTNFVSRVDYDKCVMCKVCVKKCPVDAIKIVKGKIKVNEDNCIGCGVCSRFCGSKALLMERRKETKFVPKDTFERIVISAIEQGKLQNYLFDNFDLWTNELLNRFVGVILSLPPAKFILANQQIRSRYLNAIMKSYRFVREFDDERKIDYSHKELK